MVDNPIQYGFRWAQSYNGKDCPKPIRMPVADDAAFNINGDATDYDLNIGDPVTLLSTGFVTLAEGNEASGNNGDAVYGIVVGVFPYWDGDVMKPSNKLPSNVSYDTNLSRQSFVNVVPASLGLWECDCDAILSGATALSDYQALIGENVDHKLHADSSTLKLTPRLAISTHDTSAAQWRIMGVSTSKNNRDFSGNYVKLIVAVNESQEPLGGTTGT